MKVGITYLAIATVEIDPPTLEGTDLPDPYKLSEYIRTNTPEVLRAGEQQLVEIRSVIVGEEEIEVDVDFA